MSLKSATGLSIATACGVTALALGTNLVMGQLQGPSPDWMLFLGRFHPLIVHLPIGVFLLVALMEGATFHPKLKGRVEGAIELVLYATVLSALGSFIAGHFLASDGGFAKSALTWHRRLTLAAVIGASGCLAVFSLQAAGRLPAGRLAYRALLGLTLGVLSLGAHFGGTMTRGETYLAKYAPDLLKPLLGGGAEQAAAPAAVIKPKAGAEPEVYAHVVAPLLGKYCSECHGEEEAEGGLRVDSLEALLKGGDGGPALLPGAAKSPLVARMLLPETNDERMPPEGKPAPSVAEISLIRFWVERGGSAALKVRDTLVPLDARGLLEAAATSAPSKTAEAAPNAPEISTPSSKPDDAPTKDSEGSAEATTDDSSSFDDFGPESTETRAPVADSDLPGHVAAILYAKCESCHNAEKAKGKLRVDSLTLLKQGGKTGPALRFGDPTSPLLARVRLPLDDKKHMPPKNKPQLTAAELAALASWIGGGPTPQAQAGSTGGQGAEQATATSNLGPGEPESPGDASQPTPNDAVASKVAEEPEPAYSQGAAGEVALFRDHVHPLLLERCGDCHTGNDAMGDLHIETHRALMLGGQDGPSLVPGDAAASPLFARTQLPMDDDEHMPPPDFPQLSAAEAALIHTWISMGAERDVWVKPESLPPDVEQLVKAQTEAKAKAEMAAKEAPKPAKELQVRGGCAACAVQGRHRSSAPLWLASLGVLGLALLRRRRRT